MCYEIIQIIESVIIGIICGGISSYLVWYVPARKIMPKIKCGGFIQRENKRKIKVINESKRYDAFDLICYLEYLDDKNNEVFSETSSIPLLEKNTEHYIKLKTFSFPPKPSKDGRPSLRAFVESNTKKIRITITYQNKYGSRQSTSPEYLKYD